ncbi:MAG TPA: PspC domain-containing protein, partial [Parasegetibacter sp.]
MKKIININLSGRLIPIEDSAYEMLKDYINSLRAYFANEEGCDEIISDIESRIAELFQEKIKAGVQCITDEDLNQIMDSIGRPEDLTEAEEPGAGIGSGSYSAYQEEESVSGKGSRFFRNANDKIIGGVCSGIAHGLQIDPALVRILYVLLAFGSFGIGVLLYLVLWALLPAHAPEPVLKKRLFRSREDRVIAGVAGGLAAYFNIPAWIPRLIFIAPLLINAILAILGWPFFPLNLFPIFLFSSIMGTFFLTYLILLII